MRLKPFDKGIQFVDKILIEGLPPSKVGDLTVSITFELTKDDVLALAVVVFDEDGKELETQALVVKKVSQL